VNADLFFLLALQQTCKGENIELALSSLLSCVVPVYTSSPYSGYKSSWRIRRQGEPVELSGSWR
jgi:hypothetical protein